MSEIIPGVLYLGNLEDALHNSSLFDRVLTVGGPELAAVQPSLPAFKPKLWLRIPDDPSAAPYLFDNMCRLLAFVDEGVQRGERVLVHCYAGISRSATVVLAYLIKYQGMSLREAWAHTQKRRPIINPNEGFQAHLKLFEHAPCPHAAPRVRMMC
jgi:hypothetical protein